MDLTFGIFCAIVPCVRYLALAAVYSIPSNRSTSPPLLRALDELGVKIPTPRFLPPTRQLATSPFSPFAAPGPCHPFFFLSFSPPPHPLPFFFPLPPPRPFPPLFFPHLPPPPQTISFLFTSYKKTPRGVGV